MTDAYAVATATDTVRIERTLPGPIELVWAYLTEPDKRAKWFAGGPMELRPGGAATLKWHNNKLTPGDDPPPKPYENYGGEISMNARVLECKPPRHLVYTWFEESGEGSEVEFSLAPKGDKVHLVLVHRRIPDRNSMRSFSGGWHAHLDILAALLEKRDPPKFWRAIARLKEEYERRLP